MLLYRIAGKNAVVVVIPDRSFPLGMFRWLPLTRSFSHGICLRDATLSTELSDRWIWLADASGVQAPS
jgi:hypothetical protein